METSLTNNQVLMRHPAVSGRLLDEGKQLILYHADRNTDKVLNSTGIFAWQMLDGISSLSNIITRLANNFDEVPSSMPEDIRDFVNGLLSEDFAIERDHCLAEVDPTEDYSADSDSPKVIDLCLTGKCNMHCDYCFYANEMAGRKDLPKEEWFTFFDELKSLGVRNVTLSGGEVFVRQDLWELIDAIITARMRFSILSNGTLIDEDVMNRFSENDRRSRISSIQISVDGASAEVHDKSRRGGAFNRAISALRMLKQNGFPVTSRVTINQHNIDDLDNIARLLLDDVGLSSFSTNSAMPMGGGCTNQKKIVLSPRQCLKAMQTLHKLAQKYNQRITASAGPLSNLYMFRDMEKARLFGNCSDDNRMGFLTTCGGAYLKLSVNNDGTITPCYILPSTELGRINQDSISEIWRHHPTLSVLRNRRAMPTASAERCRNCEWSSYCNGGCPGLAQEMTGDFNNSNPHDCYRDFLAEISEEERFINFIRPVEGDT